MGMLPGRLHVITDTSTQDRYGHEALCEMAVAGGARTIQYRDKHRTTAELIAIAGAMRDICRAADVPLIINDRADVAMAVGADGVHLGLADLPVETARELLGADAIIGATAPTVEAALAAEQAGADYIGFGHIYTTQSKPKTGLPRGPSSIPRLVAAVSIPVIAIGGIHLDNIRPVLEAGAWGVAVIGAVCAAADPRAAARALADEMQVFYGNPHNPNRGTR